jgi:hypothetical protein
MNNEQFRRFLMNMKMALYVKLKTESKKRKMPMVDIISQALEKELYPDILKVKPAKKWWIFWRLK